MKIYELIPRFKELESSGITTEYFPCYNTQNKNLHSLDIILLSYIISGNVIHYVDDKEYQEEANSLSIINIGQEHTILTGNGGAEIMNIYINPFVFKTPQLEERLQNILPSVIPLNAINNTNINKITRIDFFKADRITEVLFLIDREIKNNDIGSKLIIDSLFQIFFAICARKALQKGIKATTDNPVYKRLERLKFFIDKNYKKDISLEDYAKMSGFQKNYLCKIFKSYIGKSIFTYLKERRMQIAMIELEMTNKKVIDIAYNSGFKDLSNFNRTFKELLKMSPIQFRKKKNLIT